MQQIPMRKTVRQAENIEMEKRKKITGFAHKNLEVLLFSLAMLKIEIFKSLWQGKFRIK